MDNLQQAKGKRKIRIYKVLAFLCGFGFFLTLYLYRLFSSDVVDGTEWFVSMLYIAPLTIIGGLLSVAGFIVFAVLASSASKELVKMTPTIETGLETQKIKKRNNLAVKILFIAIIILIVVTILNDPTILSKDNLK